MLAVLGQGIFSAFYLVPWEDESGYVVVGALAARGEISLYQDEMLGERLPGPFYLLGATQLLAGRSLLAARLFSLILGLAVVALVYALGWRIGGPTCGLLAALFLGTQTMLVGYYATAMYHALCSLVVVAGLYCIFSAGAPLAGMVSFSLLSLIRPNMAVMVPLVLTFLLLRTRGWRARALLVAVATLPPLAFFLSDRDHLKLLAYVPVLHHWVRPLGYVSLFRLGGEAMTAGSDWPAGVLWFGRRYLVWLVAGGGLFALAALARMRGRAAPGRGVSEMRLIAALFVYTLAWQGVILSHYPKSIAAWTASFAALGALVLGYHAARLLEDTRLPAIGRGAVVVGLVASFALGPTLSRHANMPNPLPTASTTIGVLGHDARVVRDAIPAESRVFLVGMSILPYLGHVNPYPQQLGHSWTLVPSGEPLQLRRSGLWGAGDIDAWLGSQARFAIVQVSRLAAWRAVETYRPLAERIDEILASRFRLAAEIDDYPLGLYRVYERRSSP
jgi:4-amino-4-deoxy-L-arabinose transferase-like glycosyltransferase